MSQTITSSTMKALSIRQVLDITGISRPTFYSHVKPAASLPGNSADAQSSWPLIWSAIWNHCPASMKFPKPDAFREFPRIPQARRVCKTIR